MGLIASLTETLQSRSFHQRDDDERYMAIIKELCKKEGMEKEELEEAFNHVLEEASLSCLNVRDVSLRDFVLSAYREGYAWRRPGSRKNA